MDNCYLLSKVLIHFLDIKKCKVPQITNNNYPLTINHFPSPTLTRLRGSEVGWRALHQSHLGIHTIQFCGCDQPVRNHVGKILRLQVKMMRKYPHVTQFVSNGGRQFVLVETVAEL